MCWIWPSGCTSGWERELRRICRTADVPSPVTEEKYVARTYRKWHYRPAARCRVTGKVSFRSTKAARAFIDAVEWNRDCARVYRCLVCDWFHLTSQVTNWERERLAWSEAS